MTRNKVLTVPLLAMLATVWLTFAGPATAQALKDPYDQLDLFARVFQSIREDYVETTDDPALIEAAVNGMLRSLDPHSSYLNPKTFRDMQVQTRGEFGGLGIEVTLENGVVKVVSPIDDTPASRAGLQAGDYITHIDGEPVLGLSLSEAVEQMRGPVNSSIRLTITRVGTEKPFDVDIVRDVIRIQSVRVRAEDDVAYVRITSFNEQTDVGLKRLLNRLKDEMGDDFKGVVLDLRNNPGGLLDQAVAVSDAFLERGEIVSTRGRKPEDMQRFNAREGDLADGMPIVVLINGGSASASEIVAGALQDHKRAIILGTKSFGKGSVQTIIPLQGHGAIRLTTARYYTPSGRSIQAKGIDPDIEVPQGKLELSGSSARPSEADLPQHLAAEDDEGAGGRGSGLGNGEREDFQLAYAVDLLRGLALLQKSAGN